MAAFVTVLAAGFLAMSALSDPSDTSALKKEAAINRHLIEVQWPGPQGGPGYGPGPRGGPGYGQEWEGRREHCGRMRERLHEIRDRMQLAPPWERDQIGARFYQIRERLRHECWGHWREDE